MTLPLQRASDSSASRESILRDGFTIVRSVFSSAVVDECRSRLTEILVDRPEDVSIRGRAGGVYAARNILELWPDVVRWWRTPVLETLLTQMLGSEFGLVRVLYFDKPPERTWSLPWHKDLTIAIDPPEILPAGAPRGSWNKLTHKAGIPHVEADAEVLAHMLTLRIHLDSADQENGALWVIPGSHRTAKTLDLSGANRTCIEVAAGDVLAMRPMLAHSSGSSADGTHRHRRVLHCEFSGVRELPHGFRWRDFHPVFA